MSSIIIAIDPDVEKSGVAFMEMPSKKVEVSSLAFPQLIDYLMWVMSKKPDNAVVVVEAGWLNQGNWHLRHGDNKFQAARTGYNVGRNHETGMKIVEVAHHIGFAVTEQPPLKKCWKGTDGKITAKELAELMKNSGVEPIIGRTNQDARDAVLLALHAAGIPLRMSARNLNFNIPKRR